MSDDCKLGAQPARVVLSLRGIDTGEIAERVPTSLAFVEAVLDGRRKPTRDVARVFADATGVPDGELWAKQLTPRGARRRAIDACLAHTRDKARFARWAPRESNDGARDGVL